MIHIVDIGALLLPAEGGPPYQPLLDAGLARLTTFDPQMGTAAIGDGKPATLHVCAYPGWTSLLRPNPTALKHFRFGDNPRIVREEPIETRRLDDLDIDDIDFLKMDIQGSELPVLENGRNKLRNCAAIQIEVPFIALYENQPQFWQIDRELRSQGLLLHTFISVKWGGTQMIEADVLYLRDYVFSPVPEEVLEKMNLIVMHCYHDAWRKAAA